MSEWKPIETVPLGEPVEVGGWNRMGVNGEFRWCSDVDVASLRGFFSKRLTFIRWESIVPPTVWRELPPPPTTEKTP